MTSWSLPGLAAGDAPGLEQALQQSYELLTLAEECGQIGIWDRDIETGMMRGTATFFRIMGLQPHSEPVHMDVVRAVRHPDDARRVVDGFEQAVANGSDTYESEYRIIRPSDGKMRWIFGRGRTVRDSAGRPIRYSGVDIDITERKEAEEQVRRLMHEVNHRANNLLGVVQAIVYHTLQGTSDPGSFAERLTRRISGLAASNALLVSGKWTGILLEQLVESQVAPFLDSAKRLKTSGPPVRLTPAAAQAIGMSLHELATNATKYGALAGSGGTISVVWDVEGEGGNREFRIAWREKGGCAVASPNRTGFGTVVIAKMLELSLGGEARLDYPASGAQWVFHCPAANVLERKS